jgi:hypothetical protein
MTPEPSEENGPGDLSTLIAVVDSNIFARSAWYKPLIDGDLSEPARRRLMHTWADAR